MRKSVLCLLLSFAAGCVQERVDLMHVSKIETRTRGIGFADDGKAADAGMAGNTCRFDIKSGYITLDSDLAQGEDDTVTDAWNGNTVISSHSGGFIMSDGYMTSNPIHVFPGRNVTDARLTEDSVTVLINENNDCQIGRHTASTEVTAQIDGECPTDVNQFDVNRETGTAYFTSPDGVMTYGPLGFDYFVPRADKIEWDEVTQTLYTATSGNDVTSYDINGDVRWSASLNGRVVSFDDMGTAEAMIAMVELPDGSGELVILDAQTGQVRKSFPTPTAANHIIVSRDGGTLAVVLDNETHFFTINTTN